MTTLSAFQKTYPMFKNLLKAIDRGYVSKSGAISKCWEWQGVAFANGYGRLSSPIETKHEKFHRTHRFVLYLKIGKKRIPKGMKCLHKCDNPICCNPKHIYMGDHAQNMRDMKERGRAPKGSSHARSVFSEDDVKLIRFLKDEAAFTLTELVEAFQESKSTISKITSAHRSLWQHVTPISDERELKQVLNRLKKAKRLSKVSEVNNYAASQRKGKTLSKDTLNGLVDTFGQIKAASMLNITRRQIRHWLEEEGRVIYEKGELSWVAGRIRDANYYRNLVNEFVS